jgi:hypothetical protein
MKTRIEVTPNLIDWDVFDLVKDGKVVGQVHSDAFEYEEVERIQKESGSYCLSLEEDE